MFDHQNHGPTQGQMTRWSGNQQGPQPTAATAAGCASGRRTPSNAQRPAIQLVQTLAMYSAEWLSTAAASAAHIGKAWPACMALGCAVQVKACR